MLSMWGDKSPKIIYIHFIPRPIGEDLGYTRSYTNNKHSSRQFTPFALYVFYNSISRHIITERNPKDTTKYTQKRKKNKNTTTLINIKVLLELNTTNNVNNQ